MKDYKLRLTWGQNQNKTVVLPPDATLHVVHQLACQHLDCQAVELQTGFPRKQVPTDNMTNPAQDLIPNGSMVHCKAAVSSNKRKQAQEPQEQSVVLVDDEELRTKKRIKPDTSGDEDFARRLQQEFDQQSAANNSANRVVETAAAASVRLGMDDEDDLTKPNSMPWIYKHGPNFQEQQDSIYGKWMVFYDEDKICEKWNVISRACVAGKLGGCPATKVSTCPRNRVIIVYATRENMDQVGMALIRLVEKDLHFKRDEETLRGAYADTSSDKVTVKSIYWNRARPTFEKPPKIMKPQASRSLSERVAKNDPGQLDHSFEIVLVLVGMQHYCSKADRSAFQMGTTRVQLVRERTNAYDKHAIRVNVSGGSNIGYILKDDAKVLSPWLDKKLVCIDSGTMHHSSGESIFLLIKGMAVGGAMEMLTTFPH